MVFETTSGYRAVVALKMSTLFGTEMSCFNTEKFLFWQLETIVERNLMHDNNNSLEM